MAKRAINIDELNDAERLALTEELWESLDDDCREAIPLTKDQEAELSRRLEAFKREGATGITTEELVEKLRCRSS